MANFKPQIQYISQESYDKWLNTPSYVSGVGKQVTQSYKTYRELKKDLKKHIKLSIEVEGVCVSRSKRGEWGEWFEYWSLVDGKLQLGRSGWM